MLKFLNLRTKITAVFFLLSFVGSANASQDAGDDMDIKKSMQNFLNFFSSKEEMCGGKREYYVTGLKDKIESKDISEFSYTTQLLGFMFHVDENGNRKSLTDFGIQHEIFSVSMKLQEDGTYLVESSGSSRYAARDGKKFILKYAVSDASMAKKLQKIIDEHSLSKNNGHVLKVSGLPSGDGDILSVKYSSDESIYKQDNQSSVVSLEAAAAIYNVFRTNAREKGFDFSTEGSNVAVYDDATVDMLQGTWKGTHFGVECVAIIEATHIKIYYGGVLTDDTEYVIKDGTVLSNKTDGQHYQPFNGITSLSKSNSFTLSAHVYRDKASSSFRMYKEK